MFVAHFHLALPFDVRACGWDGEISTTLLPLSGVSNRLSQPSPPLPGARGEHRLPCFLCPPSWGSLSPSLTLRLIATNSSSGGMEPDSIPALATKPLGMPRAAWLILGRRKQLQEREPREQIHALDHPNFSIELGLAELGHHWGCPGSSGYCWGGSRRGGTVGLSLSPRARRGPEEEGRKKAELERRDSDGEKGEKQQQNENQN